MFDDPKSEQNLQQAPVTNNEEVKPQSENLQPVVGAEPLAQPEQQFDYQAPITKKSSSKIILIVVLIFLFLVVAAGAFSVFGTGLFVSDNSDPIDDTNTANNSDIEATTPTDSDLSVTIPATDDTQVDVDLDTDGDGLKDNEETLFNTNPLKADTDDDGLSDYQEIQLYETNPLKVDTDGDTYPDGEEVKNGYNPNGPGKLLNL